MFVRCRYNKALSFEDEFFALLMDTIAFCWVEHPALNSTPKMFYYTSNCTGLTLGERDPMLL